MARSKKDSDLTAALSARSLGTHEGYPVIGIGVTVPNIGGGLTDAMKFEPVTIGPDDEVYLAVGPCSIKDDRFVKVLDDGFMVGWKRVFVLHTEGASLIDESIVAETLDAQRDRIQRAKDEATGQGRLDDAAENVALGYAAAHAAGEHSTLVDGCSQCDDEKAAESSGE